MINNKHFPQFWKVESKRSRCLLRALSYFQRAIFWLGPYITSLCCMHVHRVGVRYPVSSPFYVVVVHLLSCAQPFVTP